MTSPASTMRPSLDAALARNAIAAESTPIYDATVRDHAKADVTARFAAEFADVLQPSKSPAMKRWFVLGIDMNDPDRRCINCDRLTTTKGCTLDRGHMWHVAESPASCPRCGAEKFDPCRTKSGKATDDHAARWKRA